MSFEIAFMEKICILSQEKVFSDFLTLFHFRPIVLVHSYVGLKIVKYREY